MNKIILSIVLALMMLACSKGKSSNDEKNDTGVSIKGKIKFPQDGVVVLEEVGEKSLNVVDTLKVGIDGTFNVFVKNTEPGFYRLNFYNAQFVNLILDDENVEVLVDGNAPNGKSEVKGSTDTQYFNEVNDLMQAAQEKSNQLNTEYLQARNSNDAAKMSQIEEQYMKMQADLSNQVKSKIRNMGTSIAAIFSVNYINPDENFQFLDSLATKFQKEMPESKFVKQFVAHVENMRSLADGQVAPEISLPDPQGNTVSLSSLRGQYVLVDFWAAWCKPCRMENPNVVSNFNKYKAKGFTVFGVSLDRAKEDWVAAIAKDNLSWTHVSDLKYFNSAAAATYNIQAIPTNFLLDKEGRIIARNLRGAALGEKLEELFKTK